MRSNNTTMIGGLVSLLVLAACGGGGSDDGDDGGPSNPVVTTNYRVEFSPVQVIGGTPAPDSVTATASLASARGDDITASGSVTVSGSAATSVTINAGYAGETGPAVVTLTGSGGTWNIPDGTEIDFDELNRLDASGYYVSIATPDGDLRGQILPPDWGFGIVELDAASVVPASTSDGSAKAGFAINPSTGQYRARMTVTGVSDALGAGIRNAIAGARGDVVLNLEPSATDPDVWGSRDLNDVNADDRLTTTGLDLLVSGALYISLESASNPDGDLRGQIVGDGIEVFDTELTTFEVVTAGPPVVSNAQGIATATWIEASSRFGLAVNTDVAGALGVFLMQGAPGENGTVVHSLVPDAMLPGNWVMPPTDLAAEQAAALADGELYASIVTATYTDGELRGQLDPDAGGMTATRTVGGNGGRLSVSDGDGTTYTLTVSPDALVDETVEMTLSVAEMPIPLPAGLTALAAVRLEPAGTAFGDAPVLEIDASLPDGAKVAFVANDDFSTIEYRPLRGDDAVAASLATDGAAFDAPHFSTAGVAGVDNDNDCALPEAIPGNTPEAIATTKVLDHVSYVACLQHLGVPATADATLIDDAMQPWFDDLVSRTTDPSAQQLKTFGELLAEALRYVDLAQMVGIEGMSASTLDHPAIRNLFDVFGARAQAFDTACQGGETARTDDFIRWSGKVYRLMSGQRPSGWTAPAVGCLVTARVVPEGPQAVVRDSAPIVFEPAVTGADGRDLSLFAVLSLGWETTLGLSESDGNFLEPDTSFVGLRESRLVASYFRFAEPAYAHTIVVYDHTGTHQLSAEGSATGCDDPEDDGSRPFFFPAFTIQSQSTIATSDTSATVTFSGTGGNGNVTIDNLTITAVYDDNMETALGGTATGSLSFTETGVDEDTMEPYSNPGTLDLGTASISDGAFDFNGVTGSDSFGCSLSGTVTLTGVLDP